MGDFLASSAEVAFFEFEALGEAAEELCRFQGDLRVSAFGAEDVVIAEEGAEDIEGRQGAGCGDLVAVEVVEREGVDARGGCGEVGVDLEALEVADDKQGRVAEVFAVIVELLVGLFKVFELAFVFPCEVVA